MESNTVLTNCLIAGNMAYVQAQSGNHVAKGGGFSFSSLGVCEECRPTLVNCTIAHNRAAGGTIRLGGGAYFEANAGFAAPVVTNGILWGNVRMNHSGVQEPDQVAYTGPLPLINYSDVQGGWNPDPPPDPPPVGNISANPLFCTPGTWDGNGTPEPQDDTWVHDDYPLVWCSPCVDAGDDLSVTVPVDINNEPRLVNLEPGPNDVDMGAYEVQASVACPWDLDHNCSVNPIDSGIVMAHFGCPVGTGDPLCDACDIDGNGKVNPIDSGLVMSNFGICPCE